MAGELLGAVDAGTVAAGGGLTTLMLLVKREFTEWAAKRAAKEDGEKYVNSILEEIKKVATEFGKIKLQVYEIRDINREMYKWHDKEDSNGTKIWYLNSSMSKAVEDMATIMSQQTKLLNLLADRLGQHEANINTLLKQLNRN